MKKGYPSTAFRFPDPNEFPGLSLKKHARINLFNHKKELASQTTHEDVATHSRHSELWRVHRTRTGHGRPRIAEHPPNKHSVAALALQRNASMEALCISCHRKQVHSGHCPRLKKQTHTATHKCNGMGRCTVRHWPRSSHDAHRGACLRQTTQSCYPSFCNRFAGTLWLLLSSLACVSFPSSTLVRRACVCFHHGIVLPDCRIKILGVCSSPISLSRGVGPCVKPNTHPSRNRLRCRLLRPPCIGANKCQTQTTLLLASKVMCACVRVGHRRI